MTWGIRRSAAAALAAGAFLAFASGSRAVVVTEFSQGISPGADTYGIAAGPDGNLWFAEQGGHRIGRIRPDGTVTEFAQGIGDITRDITAGPDGGVWFTEDDGAVGRIDPSTGAVHEQPPIAGRHPQWITGGPDGNVWFTNNDGGAPKVARLTPSFVYTEFPPNPALLTAPAAGIARGPDGNLWFAEPTKIGRATPAGDITEFDASGGPIAIATGSDGALWFLERTANKIGRITTAGAVTNEYAVPSAGNGLSHVTAGPDGNVWFTDGAKAGRITPAGDIAEFGGFSGTQLEGIATGPDGNLWVSEGNVDKVARLIPDVPPEVSTGAASAIATTSATVAGAVRPRGSGTVYTFQYGTSAASLASTAAQSAGAGDAFVPVTAALAGLTPNTAYVYRVVATNANGTTPGPLLGFTTPAAPPPPPPKRINVRYNAFFTWNPARKRNSITRFTFSRIPAGAKIEVRCHGKGCTFKRKRPKLKGTKANLLSTVKRLRLARGAYVEVRFTATGYVGERLRFTANGSKGTKVKQF